MSNPIEHVSNTGLAGPGFLSLQVRDVTAAVAHASVEAAYKDDER